LWTNAAIDKILTDLGHRGGLLVKLENVFLLVSSAEKISFI